MQVLHLDLRQFNDKQVELRYFFDNPNDYEERTIAFIEIQDLLQVVERDYYTSLPENFITTGLMLYDWLDGSERWLSAAITKYRRQGLVLAIATTGKLAHLPWEVLHDGKYFLVERINPTVVPVRWLPSEESEQDAPANRALRVLFTATSPENVMPVLDFEAEEGRILKATARQPIELIVEESGCLEELANLVASYNEAYFDVLHLTGHATIADDCPYFLTETETGEAYPTSAHEIAEKLEFRLPPLIFLSGCRTGESGKVGAVPSMAEQLLQQGVRAVLGWGRPVLEGDATAAAAALYQSLAAGYELPQAVAKTYQTLINNKAQDWHLLRLYVAGEVLGALVTPLRGTGRPPAPPHPFIADTTRALDTAGRVRVCNPIGFVGRRRELQRCLRALKYDPKKAGILIYGMGGLGKSTLAMRLSDRLSDYERVVLVGSVDEPSLVKCLSERFDDLELQKSLQATEPELKFRLRKLFRQMEQTNHQPFLLVLDDFETNLESRQGKFILSAKTARILEGVIFAIREQGRIPHRIVITCRYDFDSPHLQYFYKQPLARLGSADLDKKCSRLPSFSFKSQVHSDIQAQAKRLADGNPRLLEWLDKILQDSTVERAAILDRLEADPIELREQILAQVLLTQVDQPLQKMLRLGLVFEVSVPRAALQELCTSILNLDSHIDRAIGLGLLEVSTDDSLRVPRILPLELPENTEALCSQATKILYRLWRIEAREIFVEEQWTEVYRLAFLGKEEAIAAEISSVLSTLWNRYGQFRKAVDICLETLNFIQEPSLQKIKNLIALGNAYRSIAQYQKAIDCYEQALSITDNFQNLEHRETLLGNLGTCYADFGQIEQAIDYSQRALNITQKSRDRESEAIWLNNLGNYHADVGQFSQAIEYYQRAKDIVTEQDDQKMQGICLSNLCEIYGIVGQFQCAIDCGNQALAIQEKVQDLDGKGATLHSLAQVKIDQERYVEALEYACMGLEISKQIGSPKLQSEHYSALTCVYLYCNPGELSKAWAAAQAAQQYDVPRNNHHISLLLGIIALRQKDSKSACEAFTSALAQSSELLNHDQRNYRALETKWLALCGLILCGEQNLISAVIEAHRQVREIFGDAKNKGIWRLSHRLKKAFLFADTENLLLELHPKMLE
ncbi:tetratricopeptide repeat protein [Nostoc sp.]|uniref:tetratricopeptide repeat protein n=1 Tax=Nostoc sp. TaxID=1180 RepID=UPI002FF2E180